MWSAILQLAGGLGLFLLGMVIMTDGLRALAGDSLRRVLTRFTRSPASGVLTGAATTAAIQSSSATTVAAVGFVSAGLLTFPQALGVVFGANLGTTVTGWLVALLGFKLKLGLLVLPLILVGALLRLFGRRRTASLGFALAGFGVIFVGIVGLQDALSGMQDVLTPASFPPDTVGGRFVLLLLGVLVTLVTQSSSAGVAMALAAVNTGTLSFNQAAAMVIGMDVGTTATALLATVGASAPGRRTGYAHVMYNFLTGIGAFLILPAYGVGLDLVDTGLVAAEPELCLVAFHTLFNVLGVMVVLPFTSRFAAWMTRIVPERAGPLVKRLDIKLLRDPAVALEAAARTIRVLARKTMGEFSALLHRGADGERVEQRSEEVEEALEATRSYLGEIRTPPDREPAHSRHVAMYHTVDHLRRLLDRCAETDRARMAATIPRLEKECGKLHAAVVQAHEWLREREVASPEDDLRDIWDVIHADREPFRREVLQAVAAGEIASRESIQNLDAGRWLERVAYHSWRIAHHLGILAAAVAHAEAVPPHVELEPPR